jgi:hypothetical protein
MSKQSIRFYKDNEARAIWMREIPNGGSLCLILWELSMSKMITQKNVTTGSI